MTSKTASNVNALFEDLVFTDSADDFVSYEEVQNAANKLGIAMPTRDEIDYHMKTLFKLLPAKHKQKEGFDNISFKSTLEQAKSDLSNGPNKRDREESTRESKRSKPTNPALNPIRLLDVPTALQCKIQAFHDVSRGQPSGLDARLRQDEEDAEKLATTKKEIDKMAARLEILKESANSPSQDQSQCLQDLVQLQTVAIDILDRKAANLAAILARNLI